MIAFELQFKDSRSRYSAVSTVAVEEGHRAAGGAGPAKLPTRMFLVAQGVA